MSILDKPTLSNELFNLRPNNGDEKRLVDENGEPSYIGNFHKGLRHNKYGEVEPQAYEQLLQAVHSGSPADFAKISLGAASLSRKLVSPQAGLAKDLQVELPGAFKIPPAPEVQSGVAAAEAVELYWMALLRDVPFDNFNAEPQIGEAAKELSELGAVRTFHEAHMADEGYAQRPELRHSPVGVLGKDGSVSTDTIFRGLTPGDLEGPLVSQFLLKDVPYGSLCISQKQETARSGRDYLTAFDTWLNIQNGGSLFPKDALDPNRRYIRSMRDLAHYVHVDQLYEAYLNACLILLDPDNPAPVDEGNPYNGSENQMGFATFGGPHILSLVCEVATRALKAVWYQKWFVHRRLRPEAYGGLVHMSRAGVGGVKRDYGLHEDVLNSKAVAWTFQKHGTYLLPMAFPEGSPVHPAYGAGHATVAGACVTILKAWFDEDHVIRKPVVSNAQGTDLEKYAGPHADDLTVGGELNKVAANIAIGRNMAGVHWRTDYTAAVKLGEDLAICLLKQQSKDYNERSGSTFDMPHSLTLTRFDGVKLRITDGTVTVVEVPVGVSEVRRGDEVYRECSTPGVS